MERFTHYLTMSYLLEGIYYTALITVYGLIFATIFGGLLALMQLSKNALLAKISRTYAIIFRGTPLLLQMVFIYNALPYIGIKLTAVASGVVALALNEAPFIAEIIRSGIIAIGSGQILAGKSLGLNKKLINKKIIFPQAVRIMIPAFGNEAVSALKNSSLASVISVQELTLRSTQLSSATFDFFSVFFASGVMYMVLTGAISIIQLFTEKALQLDTSVLRRKKKFDLLLNKISSTKDNIAKKLTSSTANEQRGELAAEKVNKLYGDNLVLDNLSLKITKGQVAALIGPSGSGKSTLLRCLAGLDSYDQGRIFIEGQLLDKDADNRKGQILGNVGFVFQNFNLFTHLSAIENVALPLVWCNKASKEEAFQRAYNLLKKVGLEDRYFNLPSQLSGGQQQRVAIARALASNPDILLLDEPTSALDPELVGEVLDIISDLAKSGDLTMIITTHQIKFAEQVANYCAFLEKGKIIEEGSAYDVITEPKSERVKQFLALMERTK